MIVDALLLGLIDTLHGVALGTVQVLAIVVGLFWISINLYTFFPLFQSIVEDAIGRFSDHGRIRRSGTTKPDGGTDIDATPPTRDPLDFEGIGAPEIDVLLPAYEEADVIEQSIASIRDARYPNERLSVTVLLEPEDEETPDALDRLADYYDFDVLTVPERYPGPQSKPRALDFGFERTDGDIVGVIDAEDVVDPELFQEVARAIEREGHTVVQGRLDMVNEDDGWLNTAFRSEFGVWFDLVLPSFNRVGYPVPLGGTTCFFSRSALVAMSVKREERFGSSWKKDDQLWARGEGVLGREPWSMENVTEDFELGLFLWMDGHSVGYVDATTDQESPVQLDNWVRQRTRWEKGKLYTLLRYLRGPRSGLHADGHAAMQSLIPLLGPINVLGVLILFVFGNAIAYTPGPWITGILSLGLAFSVLVSVLYGVGYWSVSDKPLLVKVRRALAIVFTIPVYWILQWGAAVRALWQIYNGWLHWERTDHTGRNGGGKNGTVIRSEFDTLRLSRTHQVAGLLAILVVGVGLRLYSLGTWPLWNDEIYSVAVRSARPIADLVFFTGDPHPPGYFLLLHLWMSVFGQGVFSVRALSVVLAGATILGTFLLGRELFDESAGLVAALLVAVSTYHIHYGQMARMYVLLGLFTVLSWYYFARLESGATESPVGYLLTTVGMLYIHLGGFLVLGAQNVYMLFSEGDRSLTLPRWGRIQAITVAGALPVLGLVWFQVFGGQSTSGSRPLTWLQEPSLVAMLRTIMRYVGYPSHYPILSDSMLAYAIAFVVLLVAAVAMLLAVASYHPRYGFVLTARNETAQMAALFVVALVGPFAFSYLVTPVFAPRYTFPASIGFAVLVARGLTNIPDRRWLALSLAVVVAGSLVMTGVYIDADSNQPWDRPAQHLEEEVRPGDVVVFDPGWIESRVDYYYDGPSVETIRTPVEGGDAETIQARSTADSRVWVVHFETSSRSALVARLEASHDRVRVVRYGSITLYRFGPEDLSGPNG